MNLILTGHKGYVGRHLLPILRKHYTVHTLDISPGDRVTDTFVTLEQEQSERDKYFNTFYLLDKQVQQADVIIHCGAISNSLATRSDIYFWNTVTTQEWLKRLRPNQLFMYFSSCMAEAPFSHYGWSKRFAEDFIREKHINHVIVRPFNIYGGDESPNRLSVPRQIAERSLRFLFNDIVRDYVHVEDVCRAVIRLLNSYEGAGGKPNFGNRVYDVGTGVGWKPSELAESVGWDKEGIASADAREHTMGRGLPKKLVANPPTHYFKFKHDVIEWCKSEYDNV